MIKKVKIIEESEPDITENWDKQKNASDYDVVFRKIRRDTVGKSASNPTWGLIFNVREGNLKLNILKEGLYKEFDNDAPNGSYSEKILSIIGKDVLPNVRVPEIDIVMPYPNEPSIISYKVLDNDKEDMFHISDLMFYKYDRDQISEKKNIFTIEDILECIKAQVGDEENYKQIERGVIHTLLLDAVVNNAERHNNNWALVRNIETGIYDLAIYDHASSLVDLIEEKRFCTCDGWVSSYVTIEEGRNRDGSLGKDIIEYIHKNYNEYFNEFVDIFNEKLPTILEKIKQENLPININRLELKLNQRNSYLKKMRCREEFEHGE